MSQTSIESQCIIYSTSEGTPGYASIDAQTDMESLQQNLLAQGFMIIGTMNVSDTQRYLAQQPDPRTFADDDQYRR